MEEKTFVLTHRQNYIDILRNDIIYKAEELKLSYANSATRVIIEWLGYQIDNMNFIDNKDSGIDAWCITERGLDIFQIKTHDFTPEGYINLDKFDNEGVNDITRVKNLLVSYEIKGSV